MAEDSPGGCRSLLSAGCLLSVAAFAVAAAALIFLLFALFWLVQFVWSLL